VNNSEGRDKLVAANVAFNGICLGTGLKLSILLDGLGLRIAVPTEVARAIARGLGELSLASGAPLPLESSGRPDGHRNVLPMAGYRACS